MATKRCRSVRSCRGHVLVTTAGEPLAFPRQLHSLGRMAARHDHFAPLHGGCRIVERDTATDHRNAELLPEGGEVDGFGLVEMAIDQGAHGGGARGAGAGGGLGGAAGALPAVEPAPQYAAQAIVE